MFLDIEYLRNGVYWTMLLFLVVTVIYAFFFYQIMVNKDEYILWYWHQRADEGHGHPPPM